VCWLLVSLLLARGHAVSAAEPPSLVKSSSGLTLLLHPGVLELPEVRRHLDTGLTTSFVFEAILRDPRSGRRTSTAVIDVRWDPWEEHYLLHVRNAVGRDERLRLAGFDPLLRWWGACRIELFDRPPGRDTVRSRLRLTIVPFSSGEARDTRQWFEKSLSDGSAAEDAGAKTSDQGDPLRSLLSTLIATSISRRSVLEFEWWISIEEGEP
jgi:hypothetical protein